MLSYKQWKTLNESFDTNLGLGQPQSLGVRSENGPTLDEFLTLLDEKKKMKKKMLGEKPDVEIDVEDDETGDGEMVEPSSVKDKKKIDVDVDVNDEVEDDMDDDDMDDMEDTEDMDDEQLMMMKKKSKKKMKKCSSKKMKKKMKKENVEVDPWLQSVTNMLKYNDGKSWDGLASQNEDALIPASDPNAEFAQEPGPGEVGYAPQGKVGDFFSS
ncbi:MAG: hypothetical protein DWQ19_11910 [Crenarchaeota archaeon]|nr:MAG: hypothetical protein DWQ19_11910 [Thermoproteota archaeon]